MTVIICRPEDFPKQLQERIKTLVNRNLYRCKSELVFVVPTSDVEMAHYVDIQEIAK